MAAFEVLSLDPAVPQIRAPGAGDTYTFPRDVTLSTGTANGVLYLNGSKVATSGSALTFDGTTLTANTLVSTNQATIDGMAVGQGGGNVATNTAVGASALAAANTGAGYNIGIGYEALNANTSGEYNTSVGGLALKANTSGSNNSAFGLGSLFSNTSGSANTAYGRESLNQNTTASNNTVVGYQAGYSNTTGANNVVMGFQAGYGLTTGSRNTFVGAYNGSNGSGRQVTTGSANTILGGFDGNQGGLDIRTASNYIVLSDGDGNPRQIIDASGNVGIGKAPTVRLDVAAESTTPAIIWGGFDGNDSTITFRNSRGTIASPGDTGGEGITLSFQKRGVSDWATPYAQIYAAGAGSGADGYLAFLTKPSGGSVTERARITSGGYFKASNDGTYVNSTGAYHEARQSAAGSPAFYAYAASTSYADSVVYFSANMAAADTYNYLRCVNNTGNSLYIQGDGDVINVNGTYGTISDAKMKTDIVDAGSQWNDIKAIRFRKFRMKDDPQQITQLGVVAQELEQTSPGLVNEHIDKDKDGNDLGTTTKSVKTSVLLMKAAVALQEAMARIEQLEAKVAALESK